MTDLVHGSDDKIMQDCKEAKDRKDITEGFTEDGHETRDKNVMEEFTEDEEKLIVRMFNLVGERWSLIAGRIPGRTAEEIKVYWTSKRNSSQK